MDNKPVDGIIDLVHFFFMGKHSGVMVVLYLVDGAVDAFEVPDLRGIKTVIDIKRFFTQFKQFGRIIGQAEFTTRKVRHIENSLHPNVMFESRYFPEMVMVKDGNVLTELE